MSPALTIACFWVLAAAATATLPMRWQRVFGLALLLAAPGVLVWIFVTHGALITLACAVAVVSMMRHPLRYFLRRLLGTSTELPE